MNAETLKDLLANATPGPWEAHPDDQGGSGRDAYVCIDDGSEVVAKAMCYTARSLNRKPYEANARLIALAPQLAAEVIKLQAEISILSPLYSKRQALADENARLRELLGKCVGILDATMEESGRSIEYGEEDPFRMGEWFEEDDMIAIEAARAALNETHY